ncbi:MAG: prolipoprotein diacylglyceryl transferase [Pseudomonadota bacterium]|nr:prolipoprotein diacylglyceryl transferase [Pseudomonadota bacterium]
MPFPDIDPIAFQLGPLAVRWYALAYLAGFVASWAWLKRIVRSTGGKPDERDIDDFLTWAVIGVILGGRLGYVMIYNSAHYLTHPAEILMIWRGGMSFHGGLLGVLIVLWIFSHRRGYGFFTIGDPLVCVAPVGLFFGRLANFVNGELFGRPTDGPFGVVFPGESFARHPSQLYEALLEGVLLLILMMTARRYPFFRDRPGALSGLFFVGYSLVRFTVEFVRMPDSQIGFVIGPLTMGHLLSIPMTAFGLWLMLRFCVDKKIKENRK